MPGWAAGSALGWDGPWGGWDGNQSWVLGGHQGGKDAGMGASLWRDGCWCGPWGGQWCGLGCRGEPVTLPCPRRETREFAQGGECFECHPECERMEGNVTCNGSVLARTGTRGGDGDVPAGPHAPSRPAGRRHLHPLCPLPRRAPLRGELPRGHLGRARPHLQVPRLQPRVPALPRELHPRVRRGGGVGGAPGPSVRLEEGAPRHPISPLAPSLQVPGAAAAGLPGGAPARLQVWWGGGCGGPGAMPCHAGLHCAVPCCMAPCCTPLCPGVLCRAVPRCTTPCHGARRRAVPWHAVPYHTIAPCYGVPCCAVPCRAVPPWSGAFPCPRGCWGTPCPGHASPLCRTHPQVPSPALPVPPPPAPGVGVRAAPAAGRAMGSAWGAAAVAGQDLPAPGAQPWSPSVPRKTPTVIAVMVVGGLFLSCSCVLLALLYWRGKKIQKKRAMRRYLERGEVSRAAVPGGCPSPVGSQGDPWGCGEGVRQAGGVWDPSPSVPGFVLVRSHPHLSPALFQSSPVPIQPCPHPYPLPSPALSIPILLRPCPCPCPHLHLLPSRAWSRWTPVKKPTRCWPASSRRRS